MLVFRGYLQDVVSIGRLEILERKILKKNCGALGDDTEGRPPTRRWIGTVPAPQIGHDMAENA